VLFQSLSAAKEKVAAANALLPDAVTLERDFSDFSRLMDEVCVCAGG
jgi:hypothetical protein